MVNNRGGGKGISKDWPKFGIFFVACGIQILAKHKKTLVSTILDFKNGKIKCWAQLWSYPFNLTVEFLFQMDTF